MLQRVLPLYRHGAHRCLLPIDPLFYRYSIYRAFTGLLGIGFTGAET